MDAPTLQFIFPKIWHSIFWASILPKISRIRSSRPWFHYFRVLGRKGRSVYGVGGGRWLIKVNKYSIIHVINDFRPDTDFLPNAEVSYYHFAARLPRHFVLIPNKSIYVLQGKSGEVTCEAEGPSVSTLKWEKQQDDKSYAAVPNSQVNITKDTKYVRATLKITNAKFADTGTYKCTVSVPPNKSDYKLTKIEVKGMLVLYFIVKVTYMYFYC